ncbi:hypothetical protein OAD79_03030 [Flavobacteriales bacterium]|nr:hypothetical protein [Flavobacteriales bacterium]
MKKPQKILLSNLLKYRCYKDNFFLDYLPDEVFINLEKKDRIEYRKLRENYQIIESKSSQILSLQEDIRRKQLLVHKLKNQIAPSNSKDSYLDKMNLAKENLEDIITKFQFSISIGLRTHNTKAKGFSQPKYYLRITAFDKRFKNLYVGSSEKINISLAKIYNKSYNKFKSEELKTELKVLYSVYIRNYIWKKSWDLFFSNKHSLFDLEQWSNNMGDEMFRW